MSWAVGNNVLYQQCRNEVKTGILSIENDVNNESFGKEYVLTEQCLINELEKLKNKGILPSLIIFNACFSATIAKSVK